MKKLLILVFSTMFLSIHNITFAQTVNKSLQEPKFDITTFLFYFLIIPTIALVIIGHLLVRYKKCIIFYGRKDQMNSFFTFTLPILFFIILYFFLSFFSIHENIKKWLPIGVSLIIFCYGFFHLIKNAIIYNLDSKIFIPFVIFMKIYIGFWVGIAFVFSIASWSQNLRYQTNNARGWIWLVRLLSLVVGGIFIGIAHLLTFYPESIEEEAGVEGFDGKNPLGKTVSRL